MGVRLVAGCPIYEIIRRYSSACNCIHIGFWWVARGPGCTNSQRPPPFSFSFLSPVLVITKYPRFFCNQTKPIFRYTIISTIVILKAMMYRSFCFSACYIQRETRKQVANAARQIVPLQKFASLLPDHELLSRSPNKINTLFKTPPYIVCTYNIYAKHT